MNKTDIQNLIKELVEKTTVKLNGISVVEEGPKNIFVSVEVGEPHFFISRDGEGLQALNHIAHRIIENKMFPKKDLGESPKSFLGPKKLLLRLKDRRIEHYHAENHKHAEDGPDNLYFLLMFFVEKHILNISHNEKLSTKENMEGRNAVKACFNPFGYWNTYFCLECPWFLEQNAGYGKK